jgi:signal transduction histidine kinase
LWSDRLHEDDRDRVLAAIQARRDSGRFSVEYRWQCADGSYKHFHDQAVLLRDGQGRPVEFAGTLTDVTERRSLEGQLVQARKMDAIGKLTGGIAHDFNNLLAAVLGGLSLIERRLPLREDHLKILNMTRRAAEQGSELVGRLLAFARRQQLEPAAIEVGALSTAVTDLLAHTLGGLVELEWRMEEGLWRAFADQSQLELALMNLVINARDAMPDGGTITVEAANRSAGAEAENGLAPGQYLVLTVADSGSGISPEILEQVMEPFFTTKDVGKGTGLGPVDGLRFRQAIGRRLPDRQRSRRRHPRRDLAAAGAGGGGAPAGKGRLAGPRRRHRPDQGDAGRRPRGRAHHHRRPCCATSAMMSTRPPTGRRCWRGWPMPTAAGIC